MAMATFLTFFFDLSLAAAAIFLAA